MFDQHLWFEMAGCSTNHLVMKCHEHHLEAPFHSSNFTAVMLNDDTMKKVYRCGQNWFRPNLYWNPASGVPWLIENQVKHDAFETLRANLGMF